MRRTPALAVLAVLASSLAHAQDPKPDDASTATGLSDADLAKLAEAQVIEIFDERPDKPFDRDTDVRFTGEQLAARGATDLGSALELLPDVTIREAGRGGRQIDIRGARKGEVSIIVDGVLVSDPYYGTFDPTTIPVTDIVQIRVSTTPQSPIDGPGGPGGVIEVHTRDAIGPQLVVARLTGDSHPSFGMTGTARVPLAKRLALRISTSNVVGARDLELMSGTVGEGRRSSTGAARLEYRDGNRRIAIDGFVDHRHYISPPSQEDAADETAILMIDPETQVRATIKADDKIGKVGLQAQGWMHYLHRRSRSFRDPQFFDEFRVEDISATRYGGMALATRPFRRDFRWIASASFGREEARTSDTAGISHGDLTLVELAAGMQYERKRFRLDGAAGLAAPFGVDANPWPEAKVVAKYKPVHHLELTGTGGYKGRLPSLRERFDTAAGDPSLGPEKVAHAEVRATEKLDERLHVEVAPFYRYSTGTIKQTMGKFANTGTLDIYGFDLIARGRVHRRVELGVGYQNVRAISDRSETPLDFLPRHRGDVWGQVMLQRGASALVRAKYIGTALDQGEEIGNYVLVEANLTAHVGKKYLAVLRVEDLLDRRPEIRSGGFRAAGRVVAFVLQGSWD